MSDGNVLALGLIKAREIAAHIKKGREVAGPQFFTRYSESELCDAIAVLSDVVATNPVSRDDFNRITRQLTAANARLAKYEKRND